MLTLLFGSTRLSSHFLKFHQLTCMHIRMKHATEDMAQCCFSPTFLMTTFSLALLLFKQSQNQTLPVILLQPTSPLSSTCTLPIPSPLVFLKFRFLNTLPTKPLLFDKALQPTTIGMNKTSKVPEPSWTVEIKARIKTSLSRARASKS